MPSPKKINAGPRLHGPGCSLIRTFRTLKGWKQEELAVRSGIASQPTLSCFERGIRTPTREQMRRIALALEVSVGELFPDQALAAAPVEDPDESAGR